MQIYTDKENRAFKGNLLRKRFPYEKYMQRHELIRCNAE